MKQTAQATLRVKIRQYGDTLRFVAPTERILGEVWQDSFAPEDDIDPETIWNGQVFEQVVENSIFGETREYCINFVSNGIAEFFAQYGINVEFITE